MQTRTSTRRRRIEQHTIFPIPLDERHGKARQLFSLWFGANLNVLTIVTGALATTVFRQSFLAGTLAIVLGNLIGTLFMALHAAQGPRLGVPQMVQSRGQFGARGAASVVALVIFMYVGYGATALVTGGQSLHAIVPTIGVREGIAVVGLVSLAMAIYGHDLIHAATRAIAYVSGAAVVLCYVALAVEGRLPHAYLTQGSFSVVGFLGMMSIGVFWQLGYAPYVSDYSRYLPPDTGPRQAFWASYWGTTLGAVLPMIFGALIGPAVVGGDVVAAISALTGKASTPIVMLFTPGVAVAGAICIYGGTLAVITLAQTFAPSWHASWRTRAPIATAIFLVAVALGTVGAASFLPLYSRFTELLLYLMVPWTAVNLVDYYWVRFGDYHVPSFFAADGGVYGRYNVAALVSYVLGIVVQVPFIAADFYVGPMARVLGGIDLSWLAGLVVTAAVYYFSAPRHAVPVMLADAEGVE
ncbi:purine-cytosine permease family protein [Dyella lutea]|uniref:Cytosine permease n=1 Tax=Dyella lutea TaxID=2950441 RepID=A0ABT1FGE3_9GAMM|nr:cytosine permease [Dyella lutea]MCP1375257.1 cytosine permease [Dyella lutea]